MLSVPKSVCFLAVIGMRWKGWVRLRVLYRGIRWHRVVKYMGDLNIPPPPIRRDKRIGEIKEGEIALWQMFVAVAVRKSHFWM